MALHIVIMAGGIGSRLYPVSTPDKPKQFLDLLGTGKTLLQMTIDRFSNMGNDTTFWVVTSEKYHHFVREQAPVVPENHILCEPCARNTAPCIAYVCRRIALEDPGAIAIITPSDAYVPDSAAFCRTMEVAVGASEEGPIVTVGIVPSFPSDQYGYIKSVSSDNRTDIASKVDSFKEKPDCATAAEYLKEGGYYWNAGIFVCRPTVMTEQLRIYSPQISSVMDELEPSMNTPSEQERLAVLFPDCDKISIDYAVMEKSPLVSVVPSAWEWSDLGSFESIAKYRKQ